MLTILKFLRKMFFHEEIENPYFKIVEKILSKEMDLDKCNIYYIKGFENNNDNFELFDINFGKSSFLETLKKLEYNTQTDNLGVYYILCDETEGYIFLIADPLDLYEEGRIFKKYFGVLDDRVMSLDTVELIKSKKKVSLGNVSD